MNRHRLTGWILHPSTRINVILLALVAGEDVAGGRDADAANVPATLLRAAQAPETKPDDPEADAAMRDAGMIVTARPPKRGRQRKPAPAIPNRIVTYTPKRKRDAWTKYLRLTGLEEPPMTASPR